MIASACLIEMFAIWSFYSALIFTKIYDPIAFGLKLVIIDFTHQDKFGGRENFKPRIIRNKNSCRNF